MSNAKLASHTGDDELVAKISTDYENAQKNKHLNDVWLTPRYNIIRLIKRVVHIFPITAMEPEDQKHDTN